MCPPPARLAAHPQPCPALPRRKDNEERAAQRQQEVQVQAARTHARREPVCALQPRPGAQTKRSPPPRTPPPLRRWPLPSPTPVRSRTTRLYSPSHPHFTRRTRRGRSSSASESRGRCARAMPSLTAPTRLVFPGRVPWLTLPHHVCLPQVRENHATLDCPESPFSNATTSRD